MHACCYIGIGRCRYRRLRHCRGQRHCIRPPWGRRLRSWLGRNYRGTLCWSFRTGVYQWDRRMSYLSRWNRMRSRNRRPLHCRLWPGRNLQRWGRFLFDLGLLRYGFGNYIRGWRGVCPSLQHLQFTRQFRQSKADLLTVPPAATLNYTRIDQRRKREKHPDDQAQEEIFHRVSFEAVILGCILERIWLKVLRLFA